MSGEAADGGGGLQIALGWDDSTDGVWRVTDRARRDAEFMAGRHGDARRHTDGVILADMDARPIAASEGALGIIPRLPAVIVCPHCHTPQRLEAGPLGVKPTMTLMGISAPSTGEWEVRWPRHRIRSIAASERMRE